MLLHAPRQRHVIVFGPAPQWVEQQHGPAVATLDETLVGVLHQEGMAVVDGVTQLEGKYGICRETERCCQTGENTLIIIMETNLHKTVFIAFIEFLLKLTPQQCYKQRLMDITHKSFNNHIT